MKTILIYLIGIAQVLCFSSTNAQPSEANYDESKVPAYTLPDVLVLENGEHVVSENQWINFRRTEILHLFENDVYGKTPDKKVEFTFTTTKTVTNFMGGKATLKEVDLQLQTAVDVPIIHLLVIVPNDITGPAPAFVGLNFDGNQTIDASTEITLAKIWDMETRKSYIASEEIRGDAKTRWPLEQIIDRGYAVITAYYGDIDPDFYDGFKNGIHPAFDDQRNESSWASIGAWAWGLSRMLDYAGTDPAIDQEKVAVIGHSRLGKTALWAGAQDQRFAMVISNCSGCGGAALSRREYGETIQRITTVFPHWFCGKLASYGTKINELPIDQHELIALIAPRPVYIASAEDDQWADPRGEFLSAVAASPVYELLGTDGFPAKDMPEVNQPVIGQIGYHIRTGKHDITTYDWEQYLDFADRYMKSTE
ncbi:MAG: hypothetical protein ACERKD_14505 [Prolixibacteraceae bacterium]